MPTARVTWFSPHTSRRGSLGSGREQKARVAPLRRDACDAGAMLVRCQRPPLEKREEARRLDGEAGVDEAEDDDEGGGGAE